MLTGWAVFGLISFIPLFVQSVLGTNATQAGITITPMLLGWVGASIVGTRILLRVGYRNLSVIGTAFFTVGAFLMTLVGANSSQISCDGFRHHDGHRHGAFDPRFRDRRADQRGEASSWHRHIHASIQPFDGWDSGRERDGRGVERAPCIQLKRLWSGP